MSIIELNQYQDISPAIRATVGEYWRGVQTRADLEKAWQDLQVQLKIDKTANPLMHEATRKWAESELQSIAKKRRVDRGSLLNSARASTYSMRGIRWFWPGRFALGKLGLIGGLPDKGKGLISADMIANTTKGGLWPCNEGTAPIGSVIYFTAEDDIEDTVIPRLVAAGADLDKVHIIGMASNHDGSPRMFNLATDLPLLLQKIEEIGDVVLVIIDPVSAYLGVGKINNSSTTDVRGVLAPLTRLAEEKRIGIIGVMRTR